MKTWKINQYYSTKPILKTGDLIKSPDENYIVLSIDNKKDLAFLNNRFVLAIVSSSNAFGQISYCFMIFDSLDSLKGYFY